MINRAAPHPTSALNGGRALIVVSGSRPAIFTALGSRNNDQ